MLDDFGSGYSSLNALKDIMAENLRIRIVTEGVETEHQVKKMADIGCKVFQGYYFAKPMPVEEFTKKYLQN